LLKAILNTLPFCVTAYHANSPFLKFKKRCYFLPSYSPSPHPPERKKEKKKKRKKEKDA